VGTLDLAIAEMVAELDRAGLMTRTARNPTPKRSPSMVTNETERVPREANELPLASQAAPQAAVTLLRWELILGLATQRFHVGGRAPVLGSRHLPKSCTQKCVLKLFLIA
jgi:hypothetical protein